MGKATQSKTAPTLKAVSSDVSFAPYSAELSGLFMERLDAAEADAGQKELFHKGLKSRDIAPSEMKAEGRPIRKGITADLFARIGDEFDTEFMNAVLNSGSKVLITAPDEVRTHNEASNKKWSGATRSQTAWRQTLIAARLDTLVNGYMSYLADAGLIEHNSDGKLVKLQGTNAGKPKTPTEVAKWDDKNLEIQMRHDMTRRDILNKQITEHPDRVHKSTLELFKSYEVSIARWTPQIPKGWTHKKAK